MSLVPDSGQFSFTQFGADFNFSEESGRTGLSHYSFGLGRSRALLFPGGLGRAGTNLYFRTKPGLILFFLVFT